MTSQRCPPSTRPRASLQPQLDLWSRDGADPLRGAQFFTTRPGETFAAAAPGVKGDLEFYDRPLIITLPNVADTLNDSTLAAFVNGAAISFDGLEPVSRALADGPLRESATVGAPQVTYLAEDGIINAQTAQYRMQLLAAAVGATLVAFLVLAAVNAAIAAMLGARRDFPLRLHGFAWARIVRGRVTLDVALAALACALACALAILTQQVSTAIPPTLASIPACLAVVCVAHLVATRFVFTRVATRQFS
ncbi:hypothetical protein JT358_10075 [Micrococcales bacterium 31B]|nr:hypothetical protein [Micrococcales bacterium 31B]